MLRLVCKFGQQVSIKSAFNDLIGLKSKPFPYQINIFFWKISTDWVYQVPSIKICILFAATGIDKTSYLHSE